MKISVVFITNGKKIDITSKCIESAKKFSNEVIVVGDTNNIHIEVIKIKRPDLAKEGRISEMRNIGADLSTGDIVINADDDIWFPPFFKKKLLKYIKHNPNFESYTTKVIGINGGRYWDRAVNIEGESFMIDYHEFHPNLYYSGAFIIRQKSFADKIKWNEDKKYSFNGRVRLYENCEDLEFSNRLKKSGHSINIDVKNYVIHYDKEYITYKKNGYLVCEKKNLTTSINEITEKKEFREMQKLIEKYEL